ncbi:formimidoylglutamase [Ichthyenterobacterium magnum]|uniref:Formiminoglutamase n=1 Tax=Ichthyenterobacterium magnum TaxID=1230530 RepID=A0A420DLQ6_9FLAO|nr:formimidoylglutamase [Ichthyenterobacterium magnum]RKE95214.1 formiminoglutamase [Ichthyenterobacterium magnum]
MDQLSVFNAEDLNRLLKKRSGETKFGEHVVLLSQLTNIYDDLENLDVDYVLFGIKEDVGVFANYGKSGASSAWDAAIKILLNIQSNAFTNPKKVLILGCLEFHEQQEQLKTLNQKKKKDVKTARQLVEQIDKTVSHLVYNIVSAGKTPIIIGGGHNNAYGNIKGTSLALKKPINVVNFDAHTDFRAEEGRHSGNGFSYAYSEGFLKNYFVFGLHENYTSDHIFKTMDHLKSIQYNTFEAIEIRKELKYKTELKKVINHVSNTNYGIEIDCDAIVDIPSSAMTPSGFSVTKARHFVNFFSNHKNATYLHICEAAPTKKTAIKVGKLITYLITDFIKN